MKNYAITRIKKHSATSKVGYLINHHLRLVDVPNADPKLQNQVLLKVDDIKKFLDEIPPGTKRNAVRFVDVLFTASRFDTKKQLEDWKQSTIDFAKKKFGAENIALAVVHLDETTPHMHIIFKPVNPKTKKLGAGFWFDGIAKMKKYQDDYFKSVQHLGFDRGEPGSRAKHKTIKQFYRDISLAEKDLNTFKNAFKNIDNHIKNISFIDKLMPKKLHQKIRAELTEAYSSAKSLLLAKQLLNTENISKENKELRDKILSIEDKLELITGYENPSYSQINKLKEQINKLSEEELKKLKPDPAFDRPKYQPRKKRSLTV